MSGDFRLTPDDVREIISILENSAYQTADISTSRFRLRVARTADGWTEEWGAIAAAGEAIILTPEKAEAWAEGAICAPLPGTFYRSPQPGAPPFVEVGSPVEPDTVVAIVETMKLMTPIHAGASGVIAEILVRNAEPVESGAVLMRIELK